MSTLKSFLKILSITILLILIIDFLFGKSVLKLFDPLLSNSQFYKKLIRIDHPVYHHTLRENIDYKKNVAFDGTYRLCTNNHGFKSKCGKKHGVNYDIAFIGDSFTEGYALDYEDTFVGIFESEKNISTANLAVVSYSPKIYLSKINYLLDQGFNFKHIVIFIDISDFYDDTNFYSIDKNFIVKHQDEDKKNLKRKRFLRKHFPITNFYSYVINNITFKKNLEQNKNNLKPEMAPHVMLKGKWSYSKSDSIKHYKMGIAKGHEEMKDVMSKLYETLNKKNIQMSIAVYPWPQQLKNDTLNSIHVEIWRDFCEKKCKNFINYFPIFFEEKNKTSFLEVYKKYYFWNDVHFNAEGNKVIAERLIQEF